MSYIHFATTKINVATNRNIPWSITFPSDIYDPCSRFAALQGYKKKINHGH